MKKVEEQVWLAHCGIKQEFCWRKTPQEQLDTWEPEAFTSPQPVETRLKVLRQCVPNLQHTHVVVLEGVPAAIMSHTFYGQVRAGLAVCARLQRACFYFC